METAIIILICLVVAGLAASPFLSGREEFAESTTPKELERARQKKEIYYQAIKDVDFEHAEGKLTGKDHRELRDYYKEKAIQTVKELESIERGGKKEEPGNRVKGA